MNEQQQNQELIDRIAELESRLQAESQNSIELKKMLDKSIEESSILKNKLITAYEAIINIQSSARAE